MMTEICEYLHNWFCEDSDMIIGNIVVGDGEITVPYGQGDIFGLSALYSMTVYGSTGKQDLFRRPLTALYGP